MAQQRFSQLSRLKDRLRRRSASAATKTKPQKEDLTAKHVYQAAKKNVFPTWHQWQQLPSLLSKRETRAARIALGVGLLSLLTLVTSFYFTHRILVPAVGGEYTEGLVGEPQFVNPILSPGSTVDTDITRLVFRGLFLFDPIEGKLTPDLATDYEVNETGDQYVVHLREDATWHDGEPVRSHDVAFTFGAIADPEYKSPLALSFRGVTVETPDDTTIIFTLPEPFAGFLDSLDVGILPAHIWEGVAAKRANLTTLNLQPVGNGPYRFEKFSKDQHGVIRSYTLKRYKEFYGNRPHIETFTFKFYPDILSAIDALDNRNVEGLAFVSEEEAQSFASDRFVQIVRPALPQETILFFNETRAAALQDINLRQALDLAVDRQAIIDQVFGGHATALSGPLLPGGLVEVPEPTQRDIAAAEALLDKTDWQRNPLTGLREKEGDDEETAEVLQLEITTTDAPDMLAVAEAIKEVWTPLGIDVTIQSIPSSRLHADAIKGRAYDILLTGILFGPDQDPFPFWHSSQVNDPGVNLAQYSNRNVDDALETARATVDPEARTKAYTTFQELILEDLPAIFLVQPTYTYVSASKVQGIELLNIIDPSDRFNRAESWYIKTRKAFSFRNND